MKIYYQDWENPDSRVARLRQRYSKWRDTAYRKRDHVVSQPGLVQHLDGLGGAQTKAEEYLHRAGLLKAVADAHQADKKAEYDRRFGTLSPFASRDGGDSERRAEAEAAKRRNDQPAAHSDEQRRNRR